MNRTALTEEDESYLLNSYHEAERLFPQISRQSPSTYPNTNSRSIQSDKIEHKVCEFDLYHRQTTEGGPYN